MKFIKLTQPNNDPIFVNIYLVTTMIRQEYQGGYATGLYYRGDDDYSLVKETPEDILDIVYSMFESK